MKNLNIISIVLISIFALSLTSCSENTEVIPEKKQSSISVKILKSSVKSGEDEDEHIIIIPKVDGRISDSDGVAIINANVELVSLPYQILEGETISDLEGGFSFYNVKKGDYELIVMSNGNVIGKDYIKF